MRPRTRERLQHGEALQRAADAAETLRRASEPPRGPAVRTREETAEYRRVVRVIAEIAETKHKGFFDANDLDLHEKIHDGEQWLIPEEAVLAALRRAQTQGAVRLVGVSNHRYEGPSQNPDLWELDDWGRLRGRFCQKYQWIRVKPPEEPTITPPGLFKNSKRKNSNSTT